MKWTTWILLAASLGLLLAVGLMVTRQASLTPREEFAAIERRVAQGNFDREQTINKFNEVLIRAEEAREADLAREIRLARGKLLMQVGAFDRARNDLTIVWEEHHGDRTVERLLVELEQRAGDYRAALVRIGHLIEADPNHAEDWRTKGELHRAAADKSLEHCKQIMSKVLVPENASKAAELLDRASGLDPEDPLRVALGHDLRDLFGVTNDQEAERALSTADAGSRDLAQARAALARSLALGFDAKALTSLVELYQRAGRVAEAVDLCTAAWRIPSVRSEPRMATFLIDALSDLDRQRHAADVATYWINRGQGMPVEFYLDCCRILTLARRWGALPVAISQLTAVASPAEVEISLLYSGLAASGAGGYTNARYLLLRYLNTKAPEPFPGARAAAWREIAHVSHELGQSQNEREALEVAVDLEPDHDGESWLRLAELQLSTPHGGYRQPETRWAKGMSLLPQRVPELLGRWREMGEQELKSLGIDLESQQSNLVSERTWIPSAEASPYELFRLARLQIDDGDISRAQNSIKRLLEIVPGFAPGLDLALEVAQKAGKQRDVIAALLARMKVIGPDERSRTVLSGIRPDLLAPKDVLALMRASPDRFGRLAVARTYFAHGNVQRALATLEGLPEESLGDEGRILAAELHLRMQRPARALEILAPLENRVLSSEDGQDALVDAALGAGDLELLTRRMAELSISSEPNKARWLVLCDRMLPAGAAIPARALLKRLDSQKQTRGGDVLLRLASAALAQGNSKDLNKDLIRLQASNEKGEAQHLALLARAQDGRFSDLKAAVADLRASRYLPSRLENALLDLLSDQPSKARKVIESALETDPRETQWQLAASVLSALTHEPWVAPPYFGREAASETELFLHGPPPPEAAEHPGEALEHPGEDAGSGAEQQKPEVRDPRWAACVLLAMQTPVGRAWAQAQLRAAAPESHGELWPLYGRALLARSVGDALGASQLLEQVVTRAPDFGPAWDLLDDLADLRKADAQALSDLRLRRTQAMGEQSISIAVQWLDRVRVLQSRDDIDGALEAARSAAAAAPDSQRILAKLGELLALRGEFGPAIAAYRTASAATASLHDPDITHAFLRVLDEAERTAPPAITPAEHMAELEKLAAREPDDPYLPVAMARLDLKLDPQNPSFAVARAYARMDRFRLRHKSQSLESLAPGSAEEWVDFQLALDPLRTEALLQNELELEPGALAPWLLLGRVYTTEGKTREAIDQFALAFGLAPQRSVAREYLRARVWSEMSVDAIGKLMRQVVEAEGRTKPDEELLGLSARALYNLGPGGIGRAVALLEPANAARDNSPSAIERIGWMRALAWSARGEPEDLKRVQTTLTEILPLVVDPYRKTMVSALLGMSLVPTPINAP